MQWVTFLYFCCVVIGVHSQNGIQDPNILNPDNIYFADNRPSTRKPINRQMITPNLNLQPPNNIEVVQVPVTRVDIIETSTNNFILPQRQNDFNVGRPVFDPAVDRRTSERVPTINDLQRVRFDQNAVALTNFSINVMKNVVLRQQGNTVVSPYSIATVLALLQQGATQLSLEQITVALQMSAQNSAAVYRSQTQDVKNRRSRNILRTANNIFLADAFNLNSQFRSVAQRDFDSDVTPTNFERANEIARLINDWVASKTDQKIKELVHPDALSTTTQMVLVNAIYFKGLWVYPFQPTTTRDDVFTLSNRGKKNVPFMSTKRYFRAGVDSLTDNKVVILPFEGEEYSMMIIVPSDRTSAQSTLASLTVSQLEYYLSFKLMEVMLKIPKFTIKADTDLTPILKQMGVTQIFDQNSGLSGVGMLQSYTPQVSSAVHSAFLSIDEEGSTAAAASAVSAVALSNDESPMVIKVDRPFVAILWDEKTKVPLFMARIEDPSLY